MENKIEIYLVIFFIAFILFVAGILLLFMQYKNKQKLVQREKELADRLHQEELLSTQLNSQQQTMQHIGREIHDNVGQKLTLASLYAKQITTGTESEMKERMITIGNIVDESLNELRQLSKTLTNPELANASLPDLLCEEAKRINLSGICHVSIEEDGGTVVLPTADKNILFRLLQEFMQNSLKHSGCRRIIISLKQSGNQLEIKASDDGKGFDTSANSNGIGLQNMKQRAMQIGASFQLISSEGCGTTLTLQLPLIK